MTNHRLLYVAFLKLRSKYSRPSATLHKKGRINIFKVTSLDILSTITHHKHLVNPDICHFCHLAHTKKSLRFHTGKQGDMKTFLIIFEMSALMEGLCAGGVELLSVSHFWKTQILQRLSCFAANSTRRAPCRYTEQCLTAH